MTDIKGCQQPFVYAITRLEAQTLAQLETRLWFNRPMGLPAIISAYEI
ncbi:MAG: hypothetical protein ACPH3D_05405 [Porticoccaceae bacterium]